MLTVPCALVFQPIFTMSAQQSQLKVMDGTKYNEFIKSFGPNSVSRCTPDSLKTSYVGSLAGRPVAGWLCLCPYQLHMAWLATGYFDHSRECK